MSLTRAELRVIDDISAVWLQLGQIIGNGPTRGADLVEAGIHIHALQATVMSQAAARAHPDRLRLLGEAMREEP